MSSKRARKHKAFKEHEHQGGRTMKMKKVLTMAMAMTMTAVPLTAHAETVDEANQAYQQAEAEKTQAWNDSHGDIYSDAWQTADAKSKALYNAYLDARQHAGLLSAEAKRNSSSQENSSNSYESQASSKTQDLTGDSTSKVSNDSDTKSATPTTDHAKAIQPIATLSLLRLLPILLKLFRQ